MLLAFGINRCSMKIIKLVFSPSLLYAFLKKKRLEFHFKEKKLQTSLFVSMQNCNFGYSNFIGSHVNISNSTLGDYSYINCNTHIAYSSIGKFCSIAENVRIGLGKHPAHFASSHPAFYANNKKFNTFSDKLYYKEYDQVTIGNDVWIGNNAIVMGGITIGDGAIVSAGAVVTKNVQPYSIVGGVPAKHIKFRFTEEQIIELQHSNWWNNSEEWFKSNFVHFHHIDSFLKLCKDKNSSVKN